MSILLFFLISIGGVLFLTFLIYFIVYYNSLDEFISKIRNEYPIKWNEFERGTVGSGVTDSQIGYKLLRAVCTNKFTVNDEIESIARVAWRYQNIGGVCFILALLCFLTGKVLTQIYS